MTDHYTCEQCGGTFAKTWSDEEAMAEAVTNFGDELGPDPAIVCDACFKELTR